MNKIIKLIIGIVAGVLIILGAYFAYNKLSNRYQPDSFDKKTEDEDKQEDTKVKAPDFTINDIDGNKITLSELKGRPVIINFWASWCSPCKNEFPDFQEAYEKYGDNIVFVMINMTDGSRETVDKASSYISSNKFTMPIYYDTTSEVADTYGITSLPTTLLVDEEGYVIGAQQGQLSKEGLEKGISMLLD